MSGGSAPGWRPQRAQGAGALHGRSRARRSRPPRRRGRRTRAAEREPRDAAEGEREPEASATEGSRRPTAGACASGASTLSLALAIAVDRCAPTTAPVARWPRARASIRFAAGPAPCPRRSSRPRGARPRLGEIEEVREPERLGNLGDGHGVSSPAPEPSAAPRRDRPRGRNSTA
jgi:hypothetical protein